MSFTIPATGNVVGQPGFVGDINNAYGTLQQLASGNVLYATYAGGADPTGSSDSTAAIQAALNTGYCYVPPGTYKISNTLTVPAGGVFTGVLCGFDTAPSDVDSTFPVTLQLAAGANTHMVSVHGDNSYIGNMELDGRRSAQTSGTGDGILINGFKYGHIERVSVHDNFFRGILLTGTGTMGWKIVQCTVGANTDTGIYLDSTVTDCMIFSTLCGQNGVHGIYDGGFVNHILACDVYTNSSVGIYIPSTSGRGHLISNCGIDRNTNEGIYIAGASVSVVGNTLHSNSQVSNGGSHSIMIDNLTTPGSVDSVNITGNAFWQDGSVTNKPAYHIFHSGAVVTKVHSNSFQAGSFVTGTINVASAAKDPNETA